MSKKISKQNYLILSLLLIINLFWPASATPWSKTDASSSPNFQNQLLAYQPPSRVVVKQDLSSYLSASSYILIDPLSNQVIAQRNSHQRVYPASITKLATAITALNIYPLDELVTIKEEYKEGKVMELMPGERITIKSLVSALIVYSANDAAYTLASHHPQGVPGFINQMNLLLSKYNIKDTHFSNFDGLHAENHFSTVYDLAQLGRLAIKNPVITDNAQLKSLTVTDQDQLFVHELVSTNELLDTVPELKGLKTGWTPEAGGCFISYFFVDGHPLISVVAQSKDRFADTQKIINWSKSNLSWEL